MTWDSEFGRGRFALAYEDRVAHQERVVPFATIHFDRERPGAFSVRDEDGSVVHIPLHRVRVVYRDDEVIWRRAARPPGRRHA